MESVIKAEAWRRFRAGRVGYFRGSYLRISRKYRVGTWEKMDRGLCYMLQSAYVFLQGEHGLGNKFSCFFSTGYLCQRLKNSILKPPASAASFVCLASTPLGSALFFPCMAVPPHLGPRPAMWS